MSSLSVNIDQDGGRVVPQRTCKVWVAAVGIGSSVATLLICVVVWIAIPAKPGPQPSAAPSPPNPSSAPALRFHGVNFGGWLNLEDWFYSGSSGTDVMSLNPEGQGQCLPPLISSVSDVTGYYRPWPSEGWLTQQLNQTKGEKFTVEAFTAHRESYINFDEDLRDVASLGINHIRVAVNWAAFADALAPLDMKLYGSYDPDTQAIVVPDPYYTETSAFVTLPRGWLASFLRAAASRGLKVMLDLHAFPGGSSDGTYNGVWPQPPTFWQNESQVGTEGAFQGVQLAIAGLWIVESLVKWVENLDDAAFAGVGGLCLMNEPAHMLASAIAKGEGWATEKQVLEWLAKASDIFRKSTLPQRGILLYMNLIQTAFKDDFYDTIGVWFHQTFNDTERSKWAIIDVHWYTAWDSGTCDGSIVPGSGYSCNAPLDEIRDTLKDCAGKFAQGFAAAFPTSLKATSEFSAGTQSAARLACTDPDVLKLFLDIETEAFNSSGIEAFFWTWRMPYGPTFEPGWSLKHLMGLESKPAFSCSAEVDLFA